MGIAPRTAALLREHFEPRRKWFGFGPKETYREAGLRQTTALIEHATKLEQELSSAKTIDIAWAEERCDQCGKTIMFVARKGWAVVPIEPTKGMLDAGYAAAAFPRDPEVCVAMYRAMLNAAPQS
jgi:hypothetical protein